MKGKYTSNYNKPLENTIDSPTNNHVNSDLENDNQLLDQLEKQEDTEMEIDKSRIFNLNNNENINHDLEKLKLDLMNELKKSNKEEIKKIKESIKDINANLKIFNEGFNEDFVKPVSQGTRENKRKKRK